MPSKVKNFVRQAATNVLPTAVNLISKMVNLISTCVVCHAFDKTVLHSLLKCCFANSYWFFFLCGFCWPLLFFLRVA